MQDINYSQQIQVLFQRLNLGRITHSIIPLSGGLLHRMFCVLSEEGKFALKALNPQIMLRPAAINNTKNAEKIAAIAANYIPAVYAKTFCQEMIQSIDGQLYLIYDFVEGSCIQINEIKRIHCELMGNILAELHGLDFSAIEIENALSIDDSVIDWSDYYQKGLASNAVWLPMLKVNLTQLSNWNAKAVHSAAKLSADNIISHRDLDAKNVMWHNNRPIIIDWESAGYINPMCDFVDTALYWAKNAAGRLNEEHLSAFAKAYMKKKPSLQIDCASALDYGFLGKLAWLEYNLKRSLGIESSDKQDQQIGTDQVIKTLVDINQYSQMIPTIEVKLKNIGISSS